MWVDADFSVPGSGFSVSLKILDMAATRIRCISGCCIAAQSPFRPDGDLLLSWQKKAKPPAPVSGSSLRYDFPRFGAVTGHRGLRFTAFTYISRLRFTQVALRAAPSRRLRSASQCRNLCRLDCLCSLMRCSRILCSYTCKDTNVTDTTNRDVREASLRCCEGACAQHTLRAVQARDVGERSEP